MPNAGGSHVALASLRARRRRAAHPGLHTKAGPRGIYLEDLYVDEEARGRGCGRALLAFLAKLALERGCGRLDWSVLDWNAPSIAFYKSLGAYPLDEWTQFRLTGDALRALGGEGAGVRGFSRRAGTFPAARRRLR